MMRNVAAVLCFVILAGCASTGTNELAKQIAVRYAVSKAIEASDNPDRRRERIIQVAQLGIDMTSGEPVTLDALENAIRGQIDLTELKPSDRILVTDLISLGVAELQAQVGDGGWLSGEQLVSGREFFSWVLTAAALYAPVPAPAAAG